MPEPFEGSSLLVACSLIGLLAALARFRSGKLLIRTLIIGNSAAMLVGGAVFGFGLQPLSGLGALSLTLSLGSCVIATSAIAAIQWLIGAFRSNR